MHCLRVDIENLVCLGNQALANSNKHEIVNQDKYNLEIARCENCGHIQLNELVDLNYYFVNIFGLQVQA